MAMNQRERVTAVLDALGEPSRLAIVEHLFLGEHRVADLVEHVHLAQSTVSKHLVTLRAAGIVDSRPVGRSTVVSLCDPDGVRALLDSAALLAAEPDGGV